jgi:hypothetical protein
MVDTHLIDHYLALIEVKGKREGKDAAGRRPCFLTVRITSVE